MVLVDGGVYNNFPVDVVRDMGADIVIGVDIKNDAPSADELRAMPQVISPPPLLADSTSIVASDIPATIRFLRTKFTLSAFVIVINSVSSPPCLTMLAAVVRWTEG